MTALTKIQEQELLQLAKAQAEEIYVLLAKASFENETELKMLLQTAVNAVVNSVAESCNPFRLDEFRKNFLVVAKGFNSECRFLLHQCLEGEHCAFDKHHALVQQNALLENKIVAAIKQLQHSDNITQTNGEISC